MSHSARCLALTLALALSTGRATAQALPDSIAAWAARLSTGSLPERVDAAAHLAGQDPRSLPPAAQAAIVGELDRINQLLIADAPVDGAPELGDETFGEYYLDLVIPTMHFGTAGANRALIRSVGVGRGVQRRVARQGDAVIPLLVEMIDRDYEPGEALQTLALASFWADSTGAPLSAASRATITAELLEATRAPSYALRRAAASALRLTGDPAFLPVAGDFAARAAAAGEGLVAGALRRETIPTLTAAAGALTPVDLLDRVTRSAAAVCARVAEGASENPCPAIAEQLAAARRELVAGRTDAARRRLEAILARLDTTSTRNVLTAEQQALISGGVRMVLARL